MRIKDKCYCDIEFAKGKLVEVDGAGHYTEEINGHNCWAIVDMQDKYREPFSKWADHIEFMVYTDKETGRIKQCGLLSNGDSSCRTVDFLLAKFVQDMNL